MTLTRGRLHGPWLPLPWWDRSGHPRPGFPGRSQASLGHRSPWSPARRQVAGARQVATGRVARPPQKQRPSLVCLLFPWRRRQIGFISCPGRAVGDGTVPGPLPGTHLRLDSGAPYLGLPMGAVRLCARGGGRPVCSALGPGARGLPRLPPRRGAPGSGGVRRAGPRSGAQTAQGESGGAREHP